MSIHDVISEKYLFSIFKKIIDFIAFIIAYSNIVRKSYRGMNR